MGNSPKEAVTLFYRVRGNVSDNVLTDQLEFYRDSLSTMDEPVHLIRIANNSVVCTSYFVI